MSHFHLPGTFLDVVACCRSLGSIGLEPSLAWSKGFAVKPLGLGCVGSHSIFRCCLCYLAFRIFTHTQNAHGQVIHQTHHQLVQFQRHHGRELTVILPCRESVNQFCTPFKTQQFDDFSHGKPPFTGSFPIFSHDFP